MLVRLYAFFVLNKAFLCLQYKVLELCISISMMPCFGSFMKKELAYIKYKCSSNTELYMQSSLSPPCGSENVKNKK